MRHYIQSKAKVKYATHEIAPFKRNQVILIEFALCDERTEGVKYDRFSLEHLATHSLGMVVRLPDGYAGTVFSTHLVRCHGLGDDRSWWQLRAKVLVPIIGAPEDVEEVRRSVRRAHGSLPPHEDIYIPWIKEGMVFDYE